MLGGYVKTTSNCQGLPLGWDADITIIEDLGEHSSAQALTGEDLTERTVVGWTDLFGGSATTIHVYRAQQDENATGILITGGNSGVRVLANEDEDGDGSHLTPGWGYPIMWIEDEGHLKSLVD